MMADYLAEIDWSAPWLAPYRELGQDLAASSDWRGQMNQLASQRSVRNFRGQPICFIPQEALPAGVPYEAHIGSTGQVPTRDNLHDFFNGLVWLHFPFTKARLNELQYGQLQAASADDAGGYRLANSRGRLRDAATIFDENGALILSSQPWLVERLRAHQWLDVFVEGRSEFQASCRVILFGHALMEKLVKPYPAITTHWIEAHAAEEGLAGVDAVAKSLFAPEMETTGFSPLPVLGVPGWWPDQSLEFYSNQAVFRPRRAGRS